MLLSIWLMVVWEVSRVWFGKLPFLTQMKVSDSVEKPSQNAKKFSQLPFPVVNHFQVWFNISSVHILIFSSRHMIFYWTTSKNPFSGFWSLVKFHPKSKSMLFQLNGQHVQVSQPMLKICWTLCHQMFTQCPNSLLPLPSWTPNPSSLR